MSKQRRASPLSPDTGPPQLLVLVQSLCHPPGEGEAAENAGIRNLERKRNQAAVSTATGTRDRCTCAHMQQLGREGRLSQQGDTSILPVCRAKDPHLQSAAGGGNAAGRKGRTLKQGHHTRKTKQIPPLCLYSPQKTSH